MAPRHCFPLAARPLFFHLQRSARVRLGDAAEAVEGVEDGAAAEAGAEAEAGAVAEVEGPSFADKPSKQGFSKPRIVKSLRELDPVGPAIHSRGAVAKTTFTKPLMNPVDYELFTVRAGRHGGPAGGFRCPPASPTTRAPSAPLPRAVRLPRQQVVQKRGPAAVAHPRCARRLPPQLRVHHL